MLYNTTIIPLSFTVHKSSLKNPKIYKIFLQYTKILSLALANTFEWIF